MIILGSATDLLQLITDAAVAVDIHASWVDTVTATGAISPSRTNTAVSTAATTTIVASPAAGAQRNVKTLHVRNKGVSACGVTVQHTTGAVISQLYKATLNAGGALQMTDQGGFVVL
jgi:hypothetical protein